MQHLRTTSLTTIWRASGIICFTFQISWAELIALIIQFDIFEYQGC